MEKWGQKHLDKVLAALTALDALLLALGVRSVLDSPWSVFILALLTFASEWLTATGPTFPIPTGTPPHSPPEPKPQKGK